MTLPPLRPHQRQAVDSVLRDWSSNQRLDWRCIVVAPTGAGKTRIAVDVVREWGNSKVLFLVQKRNLMHQSATAFKIAGYKVTLVGDGHRNFSGQVVVAITNSAVTTPDLLFKQHFDVVIIDEVHHCPADQHQQIVAVTTKSNKYIRVLGLTATPYRLDDLHINEVFTKVSFVVQYKDLHQQGLLAEPKYIWMESLDNEAMFSMWQRTCPERRTIAFTKTVTEAYAAATVFRQHGVSADVVSGYSNKQYRARAEQAQVIFNAGVYVEGTDLPGIGCIMLYHNPWKGGYIQRVGRGLRPDTKDCIIIGNRHLDIINSPIERSDVLGGTRPTRPQPNTNVFQRLANWLDGRVPPSPGENNMNKVKSEGWHLSKDFTDDAVRQQVSVWLGDFRIKHGKGANRITVFHERHWAAIRDLCTERGILRLPNRRLATVNESTNMFLHYVEPGTAEAELKPDQGTVPANGVPVVLPPKKAPVVEPEEEEYIPDAEDWDGNDPWYDDYSEGEEVWGPDDQDDDDDDEEDDGLLPDLVPVGAAYSDTFLAFKSEEQEDGSFHLLLVFRNKPDTLYRYTDMLEETVREFEAAESKGRYYNGNIAGQFERTIEAAPAL